MILAVPMVVITRIVCDHLDHPYAKTLMRLLEGNVFEVRSLSWACFIGGILPSHMYTTHTAAPFILLNETIFIEKMLPINILA